MSATNAHIVHNAIAGYREKVFDEVEKRCRKFCSDLCRAAIVARRVDPEAHNFTGNLLNSIVVCLYKNREPVNAYYAAQYVPKAIRVKMTVRKYGYRFKPDYDGDNSKYRPEIETDKGWGVNDAKNFFRNYTPAGKNLFDIVIVYPVEYANWIEMERGTTGIMQTYAWAQEVGIRYLKLVRK